MDGEFIDIQVNGYAGIDFLGDLVTREQFHLVIDRLRAGGNRAALPTITTDDIPMMAARVRNLRTLIDEDKATRKLMPAFHIEGPCISPEEGYRGAHRPEKIKPATPALFEPIVDAAGGWDRVAMVTLAPEVDRDLRTTRHLVENGVVVAVGHTNASLEILREAESAGASIFTHLGNGCASSIPRHDNIINRALSLEKMKYSLIPDGHHLPWFVIKLWIKSLGIERFVFTTDCVSPADAPPGRYTVAQWEVDVGTDGMVRPAGKSHLAGSSLTMRQAYDNAINHLDLSPRDARRLTSEWPERLIQRFLH